VEGIWSITTATVILISLGGRVAVDRPLYRNTVPGKPRCSGDLPLIVYVISSETSVKPGDYFLVHASECHKNSWFPSLLDFDPNKHRASRDGVPWKHAACPLSPKLLHQIRM